MTTKVKIPATVEKIQSRSSRAAINIEVMPMILAQLAMLVKSKTPTKIAAAMINRRGLYASKIPALVATALPPWKWSKIEHVWPIDAKRPIKSGLTAT